MKLKINPVVRLGVVIHVAPRHAMTYVGYGQEIGEAIMMDLEVVSKFYPLTDHLTTLHL